MSSREISFCSEQLHLVILKHLGRVAAFCQGVKLRLDDSYLYTATNDSYQLVVTRLRSLEKGVSDDLATYRGRIVSNLFKSGFKSSTFSTRKRIPAVWDGLPSPSKMMLINSGSGTDARLAIRCISNT